MSEVSAASVTVADAASGSPNCLIVLARSVPRIAFPCAARRADARAVAERERMVLCKNAPASELTRGRASRSGELSARRATFGAFLPGDDIHDAADCISAVKRCTLRAANYLDA